MASKRVIVGISVGDINGIGLEIILKSFVDNRMLDFMIPIIYASNKVINYHKKSLKIGDLNLVKADPNKEFKGKNIYYRECWTEDVKIELGKQTSDGGKYAIKSLKAATNDLADRKIDVLVTAPINKENVQSSEFNYPGHTEYLADFANADKVLMLMIADKLKVAVATGHIPLKEVAKVLSKELILEKLDLLNQSLKKDFGIIKPRIAVLGLNPHAGDNGVIGEEDNDIVSPSVSNARQKGILAFGPYPADGFFGNGSFSNFDGVLAMYHDQGLAPFKTLSFGSGVNYTAGLPIVRTSPDHGTAYDIAGKNGASEVSFRSALFQAVEIFRTRKQWKEMNSNPLPLRRAK